MPDDLAIKVDGVSKEFKLPHEKHSSIKGLFVNISKGRRTYERQQVLKDISFEIKKGEFFGIVGRNGSGKSTLLKLLAGIYTPDKGHIQINGKLTPFIELGVGFNPELTGRENVFLNGALLGFNRPEMEALYDEIVEFAELEKFMDQKLKNYSSGMQVRLAFSVAIRANTDILLLDEVLAVGDENFQRKCYEYFGKLKKIGKTVVFVSHDMDAVRDFCTKAILIHQGKIIEIGSAQKIVNSYAEVNFKKVDMDITQSNEDNQAPRQKGNGAVIEKVYTARNGKKQPAFKPQDTTIGVEINITAQKLLDSPVIGMIIQDAQGRVLFATNTKENSLELGDIKAGSKIHVSFEVDNIFTNGTYIISCAIANFDRSTIYSRIENICQFAISGRSMAHSLAHPRHTVKVKVV